MGCTWIAPTVTQFIDSIRVPAHAYSVSVPTPEPFPYGTVIDIALSDEPCPNGSASSCGWMPYSWSYKRCTGAREPPPPRRGRQCYRRRPRTQQSPPWSRPSLWTGHPPPRTTVKTYPLPLIGSHPRRRHHCSHTGPSRASRALLFSVPRARLRGLRNRRRCCSRRDAASATSVTLAWFSPLSRLRSPSMVTACFPPESASSSTGKERVISDE